VSFTSKSRIRCNSANAFTASFSASQFNSVNRVKKGSRWGSSILRTRLDIVSFVLVCVLALAAEERSRFPVGRPHLLRVGINFASDGKREPDRLRTLLACQKIPLIHGAANYTPFRIGN
jgi:hypothetical protein